MFLGIRLVGSINRIEEIFRSNMLDNHHDSERNGKVINLFFVSSSIPIKNDKQESFGAKANR